MERVQHLIGHRKDPGSGDRFGDVYDPALGRVVRTVAFAEP